MGTAATGSAAMPREREVLHTTAAQQASTKQPPIERAQTHVAAICNQQPAAAARPKLSPCRNQFSKAFSPHLLLPHMWGRSKGKAVPGSAATATQHCVFRHNRCSANSQQLAEAERARTHAAAIAPNRHLPPAAAAPELPSCTNHWPLDSSRDGRQPSPAAAAHVRPFQGQGGVWLRNHAKAAILPASAAAQHAHSSNGQAGCCARHHCSTCVRSHQQLWRWLTGNVSLRTAGIDCWVTGWLCQRVRYTA
jgi:hypothetical protein